MRHLRRVTVVLVAALALVPLAPAAGLDGLDAGFGDRGLATVAGSGAAMSVAVQPDGRIVVGGWRRSPSVMGAMIARVLPDGSPDVGFGTDGVFVFSGSADAQALVTSVAVQPDGRIVASVHVYLHDRGRVRLDLIRLSPRGQLDPTFGTGGRVLGPESINFLGIRASAALQPDGKILLTDAADDLDRADLGDFDLVLRRYTADGSPDGDFGDGGSATVDFSTPGAVRGDFGTAVVVLPDGRIVVGGESHPRFEEPGEAFAVARLTPSGALDPTFGAGGKVLTQAPSADGPRESMLRSLAARPDGTVVAAGTARRWPSSGGDFAFVRYTATGELDDGFGTGGVALVSSPGSADDMLGGLSVDAAGRLVAVGARMNPKNAGAEDTDMLAVRLLATGLPDLSFGGTGRVLTRMSTRNEEAMGVAVLRDGRVLAAGQSGDHRAVVVRYPATAGAASFGWNPVGQLGTGTSVDSHAAVAAPALYGTSSVSAGAYHGLAAKGDGRLWAWGWNGVGQLGDGTTSDRWSPVPVSGLESVRAFAAGQYHSLAVDGDTGEVWAWGWNATGQLGDGTTTDRHTPVALGPGGVTGVAAGQYHSLAVTETGSVLAWGWNGVGQLGTTSTLDFHSPVPVGLSDVVAVAAGYYHSLALRSDGTVWAWGWNVAGQLGDGTDVDRWSPVQVTGLTGVKSVSAGAYHSLAVLEDGTVRAWGWNAIGQLGDGTTVDRWSPVPVSGLTNVTSVSGGALHNLAARRDGTVRAWGWNGVGQLGTGGLVDSPAPAPASGLSGVNSVAAGLAQSFAVGP